MTDLSQTIAPKSDQLNADDLIAGPRTITITKVSKSDTAEQPIRISFDGDNGKPYLPCKSMRRVLVQVWGKDGATYAGRSMTLYRDESVKFGGEEVGGIRISHMTDIDKPITLRLTASKANRKPFTVKPLQVAQAGAASQQQPGKSKAREKIEKALDEIAKCQFAAELNDWREKNSEMLAWLQDNRPADREELDKALEEAAARIG